MNIWFRNLIAAVGMALFFLITISCHSPGEPNFSRNSETFSTDEMKIDETSSKQIETTTSAPERATISETTLMEGLQTGSLTAETFQWFFENDYNGEKLQVLAGPFDVYGANPIKFKGAVFYRAGENESLEEILHTMLQGVCEIFTQEENRACCGYVMTDYRIYDSDAFDQPEENLKAVGEEVWRLQFPYIFYRFDGKDFGLTFEELKADTNEKWIDENGLILCYAEGSDDAFQRIIVKKDNVYLMASPSYFIGNTP